MSIFYHFRKSMALGKTALNCTRNITVQRCIVRNRICQIPVSYGMSLWQLKEYATLIETTNWIRPRHSGFSQDKFQSHAGCVTMAPGTVAYISQDCQASMTEAVIQDVLVLHQGENVSMTTGRISHCGVMNCWVTTHPESAIESHVGPVKGFLCSPWKPDLHHCHQGARHNTTVSACTLCFLVVIFF